MSNDTLNLIIIQTQDIGSAYSLANRSNILGCEIAELSILGTGALLIFETKLQSPSEVKSKLAIEKSALISCHHQISANLFKAYLSVNESQLQSELHIFESHFLGDLFKLGETLDPADVVDLRFIRGSIPRGYLFTSKISDRTHEQLKLCLSPTKLTSIPELSSELKSFFELVP